MAFHKAAIWRHLFVVWVSTCKPCCQFYEHPSWQESQLAFTTEGCLLNQ